MKLIFIMAMFIASNTNAFDVISRGDNSTVGSIMDEAGLVYNKSDGIAIDSFGAKRVSVVVTYSSVTFANVSFSTNAYSLGGSDIAITAHGLTRGLPVAISATAGALPEPFTATTYYAIPIDANTIQLATTSLKAIAGDPIKITTKGTGAQTYLLTVPSTIAGTPSYKWQGANNGGIFDIAIASVTISSYGSGNISTAFDFEWLNYTNLILNVISPTTGAIKLKAIANLKY